MNLRPWAVTPWWAARFLTVCIGVLAISCGAGMAQAQTKGLMFSSVTALGTNLVLVGSGGKPGATYQVMASKNLMLSSLSLWTAVSTNVFATDGAFSNSIPIDLASPQGFFLIAISPASNIPGLVAAYSFNEGVGTTAVDASGNGNDGTVIGATWTNSGKYGSALVFDGTNSLVTINNSASLQLTAAMTLEAWVNPFAVSSSWEDVVYKEDDNYFLEATSPGSGQPAMGGTFGGTDVPVIGREALGASTWTHLAASYDGATLRLYVNGVEAASQAQTGDILTSVRPLQIGGDSIYGQYFQGMIDEVRVYNVALTAAQILTDMSTPVGTTPTAPGNPEATVVSGSQVNLSWKVSMDDVGVTGYFVERCQGVGCAGFTQIGTATGTAYSDTGLTANTTYNYRVRAIDSAGNLGPYSQVVQAYTGLSISPQVAVLTFTRNQLFTASSGSVTWSVDGLAGGSATAGTITAGGLYTPPNSVGTHKVTAMTTDQSQTGSSTVYVTGNPGVYTYHNDNFRTGQNLNETVLTLTNVNSASFGKLFSYTLDGLSFGSPVYVANVDIPGHGFHNVVYVATEHDSVYAFDADGLTNAPIWQVSFIDPAAGVTTVPAVDAGDTGDIPNEIGITSTPVIDPASGTIYLVAKTKEVSGSTTTYVQRLHALDIATGAEKFGGPVVIQAGVPGTGSGSLGTQVPFDPLHENQRTGLLLANGVVYFGFASHGDNPPYHGWVLGYTASTLQQVMIYCDTANGADGGIWMNGDGAAADSAGNLYFISGNGDFDADTGGIDYGDSFIKISPAAAVLDYFTPYDQAVLSGSDLDLGSGGVLLLPDQAGPHPHEMVSAGKNGTIYLVDRDNMGNHHPDHDQIVQPIRDIFVKASGIEGGNFSSPIYFNGSVYFSPVSDNIQAFQLSNGMLSTAPTSRSSETYDFRGGTMTISANGNTNGIVWSLQSNGTTAAGVLRAYDATNLGNELYDSDRAGARDRLDSWWKFTVPTVVNGKVFVTSVSQLTIYGLLP